MDLGQHRHPDHRLVALRHALEQLLFHYDLANTADQSVRPFDERRVRFSRRFLRRLNQGVNLAAQIADGIGTLATAKCPLDVTRARFGNGSG